MDLKELIQTGTSARERDYYVSVIASSQKKFDELLELLFREKDPIQWRLAWVLDGCDEKDPTLAEDHLSTIISSLSGLKSTGTRRSLMRLLTRHRIPENDRGMLVDLCFGYLSSEIHSVAIQVYSMQIIYNLTSTYPELAHELIAVLEDRMESSPGGYKARARMIINQLNKL
jgi:hypothetical protein